MNTDSISIVELGQLHESPFNPRKTFTDVDQLAASIKAEGGILSPVLVRPRLTNPLRDDLQDGFEIIFGHRRFRAAELAGLSHVPCMVRAMTDGEARSAQIAENLARADVHPIEEAVYGRLKLLQACALVRNACLAGQIGSEVALLIARLRTDKLQQKALARIAAVGADLKDGGKASFRRIRAELAEKFTLKLKDSMFEREDATLLPGAGVCSACPKRCGNAPEFEDVATQGISRWDHDKAGEPDLCTDPDCWEAKTKAHLARKAAVLEADGKVVITGAKARTAISAEGELKNGYVPLAKVKDLLKKAATKPTIQHVQDPRTGKVSQAVLHADLVAAGLAKPEPKKADKPKHEAFDRAKRDREYAEQQAQCKAETTRRMALLQRVRQEVAARQRDAFDLRLVAAAAFAGVYWHDKARLAELHGRKSGDALKKDLDTMAAAQLETLIMDCALIDNVHCQSEHDRVQKPAPLLALAAHYGIDAKAFLAPSPAPPAPAAKPASTPSSAGASAKKSDGKAKPAKPAAKGPLRGVAYRCKLTGATWSGKGLQPAWLKAKLAAGFLLSDFSTKKVSDEAGSAGADRDTNTADLFEAAQA
jgi:ParB/RepB/Spo0J family partition protein